jgi:hypothetical protein
MDLLEPADRAVVGASPRFRWVYPDGADLVAVAVFRTLPQYMGDESLQLKGDQVMWIWFSSANGGVGTAVADYASGSQYTQPAEGGTCEPNMPPPLEPGIYYWAAWGLKAGALKAKSRVFTFSVNAERVTGQHCSENSECGELPGASCDSDKFFCTLPCASDFDCFSNQLCDLSAVQRGKPSGVCRAPVGCQCAENETCDSELQICYRGTRAFSAEASCDCPGGGPGTGKSTFNLCLPLMGIVTLAGRKRSRRC